MKKLILKLAKKYIIQAVNDLLKKSNVIHISVQLNFWIKRLQKILNQLELLYTRVEDGNLDENEVDDSITEIKVLIKEF